MSNFIDISGIVTNVVDWMLSNEPGHNFTAMASDKVGLYEHVICCMIYTFLQAVLKKSKHGLKS